ncbi:MAG TPA: MAPEG family protein [Candidatus Binatia bacterium]|nr:MAPEG family protein [Candidatus Binatia bacterium]
MLDPMLALVLWTFVMWLWMYAVRLPAMRAAGIDPARIKRPGDLDTLPIHAQQVADNYNHLHEQPVLFYALVTYCHLTGAVDSTNVTLAWSYVVIRVAHSIVQSTFNFVPVRFAVFSLGSIVLFAIGLRALLAS